MTDLKHALSLLKEADNWEGSISLVEVDAVCEFRRRCGKPLAKGFMMLATNKSSVNLLCLCETHSAVMMEALAIHRKQV